MYGRRLPDEDVLEVRLPGAEHEAVVCDEVVAHTRSLPTRSLPRDVRPLHAEQNKGVCHENSPLSRGGLSAR